MDEILKKYIIFCNLNLPAEAGDLVQHLEDETCKVIYDRLVSDPRTKNNLVRALLYNYKTQKMRW